VINIAAAVTANTGFRVGLMATAFGFGFRHGIDWDHIAALTDITSSQKTSRQSMLFATLYALGHGLVVLILGLGAILLSANLPKSVDGIMARFVGATLIILGIYVFYALAKHGRDFRMRSRWMLIFSGVRRAFRWLRARRAVPSVVVDHSHEHRLDELHEDAHAHAGLPAMVSTARSSEQPHTHSHRHRHAGPLPDDPFMDYGKATSFGIGMIHGVGAETPTQILIFLAAAGAGGKGAGVALLMCFLVGLLCSNTTVALASTYGFIGATRNWKFYVTVSVLTAAFSLVIGTIFLFGKSTLLPAMFGG
jgi:high-affinity nickel-transport protein